MYIHFKIDSAERREKLMKTYNERSKKKIYIRVFASDFLFGKLPFSSV